MSRVKHNRGVNAGFQSTSVQTEEIDHAALTIDQKLQRIDLQAQNQLDMERAAPYKQMEGRI